MMRETAENLLVSLFSSEVVTGSKQMAGIDAIAYSVWVAQMTENVIQLFEGATDRRSLSGRILDSDLAFSILRFCDYLLQSLYDHFQPFDFTGSPVCSRMKHNKF